MGYKFKDLKKLSQTVNGMCAFAEQIRNQIHDDLESINETQTFIGDITQQLASMQVKLIESQKTLEALGEVIG